MRVGCTNRLMRRCMDFVSLPVHPFCQGASADLLTIQSIPCLIVTEYILLRSKLSKSNFHSIPDFLHKSDLPSNVGASAIRLLAAITKNISTGLPSAEKGINHRLNSIFPSFGNSRKNLTHFSCGSVGSWSSQ